MKIELQNISKRYIKQKLFENINYLFQAPCYVALVGQNGAGKSTLLQIISGYVSPTQGNIIYTNSHQQNITRDHIFEYVSICSPAMEIIEEYTLAEFLQYHFSFKKNIMPINEIVAIIGLENEMHKKISEFSSGMKQRVKLAQAFFADTPILLLDEPLSNLDTKGYVLYHTLIKNYTNSRIVIVASNNEEEYHFCHEKIQL